MARAPAGENPASLGLMESRQYLDEGRHPRLVAVLAGCRMQALNLRGCAGYGPREVEHARVLEPLSVVSEERLLVTVSAHHEALRDVPTALRRSPRTRKFAELSPRARRALLQAVLQGPRDQRLQAEGRSERAPRRGA
jgi:hypothetical protein